MEQILNPNGIENRDEQADKVFRFLEKTHASEIFDTEEHKRDYIRNLSYEDFEDLLVRINGLLREKPIHDREMDGSGVGLKGAYDREYISPQQKDKPELLNQVLQAVKKMNEKGEDLNDIAIVLSSVLNAIHSFKDGNGRTSRLVYQLLSKDFNNERMGEIESALSNYGRYQTDDINPGLIQDEIDDLIKSELGLKRGNRDDIVGTWDKHKVKFSDNIDKKIVDRFTEILREDDLYLALAVYKFLQGKPDKERYIVKYPQWSRISADEFSENATENDINAVLDIYADLKKEYVEKLIDALANPDKEEYQIGEDEKKISLREYLKSEIKAKTEMYTEKDRLEKQQKEAEENERRMIEEKENAIKERFNAGEGEYITFENSEIEALKKVVSEVLVQQNKELTEAEKFDLLKESLYRLVNEINNKVKITQEQINTYVQDNRLELVEYAEQYAYANSILDHLNHIGIFKYRFSTSNNYEIPYKEADLQDEVFMADPKNIANYLHNILTESIYYITAKGSSLRIKLFNIKSKNSEPIVQEPMERVFYSDKIIDHRDKKVVKVDDVEPTMDKYIFEIASDQFKARLNEEQKEQSLLQSPIGVMRDEDALYVNLPEKSTLHSGYFIVSLENL